MNSFSLAVQLAVTPAVSLLLVLLLGGPMIAWLRKLGAGQRVRDDGPQRHLEKEGTPTMGGVLIVAAAAVGATVAQLVTPAHRLVECLTLGAVMLAFASIGAADDWLKIKRGRSLGLRARHKLLFQTIAAGAAVYALGALAALRTAESAASGGTAAPPTTWMPPLLSAGGWALAMVLTSNAVNLADGLDGLAAGLCAVAALGFGALGLKQGEPAVVTVGFALAGSCLGFLYFNRHPARVFMGDVGSLALGGALAALALRLDSPLALIGLCLVPFIEAASVVIQVISFKATRKRVFKMSPIHHHFELSGWPETRVVVVFWLVGMVAAAGVVGLLSTT